MNSQSTQLRYDSERESDRRNSMGELTKTQSLYVQIFYSNLRPALDELGNAPGQIELLGAITDAQRATEETLDFCEHDRKAARDFIFNALRTGAALKGAA